MLQIRKYIILFYIRFLTILINSETCIRLFTFLSRHKHIRHLLHRPQTIKNVAFIMDGNRRHAKLNNISDVQSKTQGYNKMIEIAEFCHAVGIKEISFFAFSLDNLKRSKEELESMKNIIVSNVDRINTSLTFSPKISIYGEEDRVDPAIREVFEKVMKKTEMNKDVNFNIFYAYSAREELKMKKLYYEKRVDLLVRTSGEKRMSDFLLKQCCQGSNLFFCKSYWPDFSVIQLFLILYKSRLEEKYF